MVHCVDEHTMFCMSLHLVCCMLSNNCSASRLPKAMAGSSNDFEEFKKQTDDAWDGGDDDLLLEAFNVRISRRDVQSAATQVFVTLLLLTMYSV